MRKNIQTLKGRLGLCAKIFGGKKDLAIAAGISEAQFFRYLRGDVEPPLNKLASIATVTKLSLAWLCTGEGRQESLPLQKSTEEKILEDVIRTFEETLVEYEQTFTPQRKSKVIPLIYKSLIQQYETRSTPPIINKPHMLDMLDFLYSFKSKEQLEMLEKAIIYFETSSTLTPLGSECSAFVNQICRAQKKYYSTLGAQLYFDRIGLHLREYETLFIETLLKDFKEHLKGEPISFLDMGCGNGRYLYYLHNEHPYIHLKGIEPSSLGLQLLENLEQANKLPAHTIKQADARQIPFSENTFNLLFCQNVLFNIPYFPNSGTGIDEVFNEARRVLKNGGLFYIMYLYGSQREYLPFVQPLTEENIKELALKYSFEVLWQKEDPMTEFGSKTPGDKDCFSNKNYKHALLKIKK